MKKNFLIFLNLILIFVVLIELFYFLFLNNLNPNLSNGKDLSYDVNQSKNSEINKENDFQKDKILNFLNKHRYVLKDDNFSINLEFKGYSEVKKNEELHIYIYKDSSLKDNIINIGGNLKKENFIIGGRPIEDESLIEKFDKKEIDVMIKFNYNENKVDYFFSI
ncbi:MAG: hypothetical protein KatS3mg092_0428 [Patescibacteria group bacterium]|nr:MAG: hypothetical protein KatS3mg092_0428 [Patescibacteria group bacterium]